MLHLLRHPLIDHKVTLLRKKETKTRDFRQIAGEIAGLMVFEMTRNLPVREIEIETPITKAVGYEISKDIVLVPILRAGMGMVEGIEDVIPDSKIGLIGLYRDEESLQPVDYYSKFPKEIADACVFVLDPMLATGGSSCAAIQKVKDAGAKDIKLICIVGSDQGVETVTREHPDVDIYLAALDHKLNENGYIVPGLGDAGDRIFGTK